MWGVFQPVFKNEPYLRLQKNLDVLRWCLWCDVDVAFGAVRVEYKSSVIVSSGVGADIFLVFWEKCDLFPRKLEC